jgi:hypothetical protein
VDVIIKEERHEEAPKRQKLMEQPQTITVPANNTVLYVSSEFFKAKVNSHVDITCCC